MASLRVGNAPCSWGTLEFETTKSEQVDFRRMLDELVETGYTGTELGDWGYMPTDAPTLTQELEPSRGGHAWRLRAGRAEGCLRSRGGINNAVKTARLLAAVARDPAPFLVLADNNGSVPERTLNAGRVHSKLSLSPAEWKVFAEGANSVARAVLDATGLRTVFHHHCAGYVETPDEIAHFLELHQPASGWLGL